MKKKMLGLALAGLTAGMIGVSSPAQSAETKNFNVDGLLGVDFLSGGTAASTSNLGFGGRVGYHLDYNWEVGGSFTTTSNSTTAADVTSSSRLNLIMADLNYHLDGDLNPLYFGIRLGMGISSGSTNATGAAAVPTKTSFAWGLTTGYDFFVHPSLTIGPRVSYTMIPNTGSTNQSDFQLQAAVKYFF